MNPINKDAGVFININGTYLPARHYQKEGTLVYDRRFSSDPNLTYRYEVPDTESYFYIRGTGKDNEFIFIRDGQTSDPLESSIRIITLPDEEIIKLIQTGVHSGVEYSTEQEIEIKQAFENGHITWNSIYTLLNNSDKYDYFGGRWVISKLETFSKKYPQFGKFLLKKLMDDNT
tara:strand:+ start:154 stop:675 length:522 start_codon:yes stop_codon:yes gene_type:complete